MTAKITKIFVIYWCLLVCLTSPVMAGSLADKYEDQKNKGIEINPDVQAFIEARAADNRLVIEKGKLHIIGQGYPKAFQKLGNNILHPVKFGINWFGVYELEDGLFGFLRSDISDKYVCHWGHNPISLQLVALAKRDDKGSYTFKSRFGMTGPYLQTSRLPKAFELNLKTKSCFYEKDAGSGVAKCEILSPPDSYNFRYRETRRVQQTFEADIKRVPRYLEKLKTCKFRK
ncbi:hypothetical protein N8500_09980 [Candidatus Puniceispirillum sp.]|nr:hypothetical protein [Candidatus Puniceispirillum sp.]